MGNAVCCKGSLKSFRRKEKKGGSSRRPEDHRRQNVAHTYDTVADFPVYAVVRKNRQKEESVQYADIQVFSKAPQQTAAHVKNLQASQETEYATLTFPRPSIKYDHTNGTLV
ncbi:uncharacterized protein C11orf52 homolog [Rhinatrema bivittatum]|uniref:uncharacterized protein C11orf52 homolog n=1 Tax=Rhinatrema bivittatum TaxID=194408 RepID=UPI00112EAED4|nr:uncharacterized protein C11orf52 homolog [Rhinatrema bivittatum]